MKMKLFTALAALLLMAAGTTTAEARRYDGGTTYSSYSDRASGTRKAHYRRAGRRHASRGNRHGYRHASRGSRHGYRQARRHRGGGERVASYRSSGVGARPGRWCGWYMRTRRGGGPEYNLAWNWRNYGSASGPQVGAVVVWRHHVGEITGRTASGQWIVRSGNDGGRVRERARSVSGAIFRVG